MKPNSLVFSFSPNGDQKIIYCAWCDARKELSIPLILDISIFDFPISHGICDLHRKEFKVKFQSVDRIKRKINETKVIYIESLTDFEYFASRNS